MRLAERDADSLLAKLPPQQSAAAVRSKLPREHLVERRFELVALTRHFQHQEEPPSLIGSRRRGTRLERRHVIQEMGFTGAGLPGNPEKCAADAAQIQCFQRLL